jgi:hypothetical protein
MYVLAGVAGRMEGGNSGRVDGGVPRGCVSNL